MESLTAFHNYLQAQLTRHLKRFRATENDSSEEDEAWEGLNATMCIVQAFNQYFPERKIGKIEAGLGGE